MAQNVRFLMRIVNDSGKAYPGASKVFPEGSKEGEWTVIDSFSTQMYSSGRAGAAGAGEIASSAMKEPAAVSISFSGIIPLVPYLYHTCCKAGKFPVVEICEVVNVGGKYLKKGFSYTLTEAFLDQFGFDDDGENFYSNLTFYCGDLDRLNNKILMKDGKATPLVGKSIKDNFTRGTFA